MSGVVASPAECHQNTCKLQIGPSRVKSTSGFKGFHSSICNLQVFCFIAFYWRRVYSRQVFAAPGVLRSTTWPGKGAIRHQPVAVRDKVPVLAPLAGASMRSTRFASLSYVRLAFMACGYSAEGGAVDGGCSGWRAQVEQQAGHSHITNAGQILEIQIKITSDYTWFGFHYTPLCGM